MSAATTTPIVSGYETVFITRAEMTEQQFKDLNEKIEGAVKQFNGEIVLNEDWGTKRFAYKIEKDLSGKYTYVVYTGKGNIVAEVERNLRLNDHVLRFLSVNIAPEFNREAFDKHREEMKAQAKKREEEREARREERFRAKNSDYMSDDDGSDDL